MDCLAKAVLIESDFLPIQRLVASKQFAPHREQRAALLIAARTDNQNEHSRNSAKGNIGDGVGSGEVNRVEKGLGEVN